MKNIILKNRINLLIMLIAIFFPLFSNAMNLKVENPSKQIKANDVVILNVFLNSEDKEINAIDGSIKISGNYEIKYLNVAGSIFDLWPNKPSYSQDTISFVGGSTAGVFGSHLKVFSVAIKPRTSGDINFSGENIEVFLNDGLGTKVIADSMNQNIVVSNIAGDNRDELKILLSEDKIPPKDFEITIGRDDSLFDGKYFVSFNTIDNESGLNRYEIIENNNPAIITGNTYVLQNQNLTGTLEVRAIDNADNVRSVKIQIKDSTIVKEGINWPIILISVLILLIIKFALSFFLRRNAHR